MKTRKEKIIEALLWSPVGIFGGTILMILHKFSPEGTVFPPFALLGVVVVSFILTGVMYKLLKLI